MRGIVSWLGGHYRQLLRGSSYSEREYGSAAYCGVFERRGSGSIAGDREIVDSSGYAAKVIMLGLIYTKSYARRVSVVRGLSLETGTQA